MDFGKVLKNMLISKHTGYKKGDSGGPLVVQNGTKWYLGGLTSWGYDCGSLNFLFYDYFFTKTIDLFKKR